MKQTLVVISVVTAAFVVGVFAGSFFTGGPAAQEQVLTIPVDRREVTALGKLLPRGGVIDVGGTAGERIARLLVREGDHVQADQPLAHLASLAAHEAEFQRAQAALSDLKTQHAAAQEHVDAVENEARLAMRETGKPLDLERQIYQKQVDALKSNLDAVRRDTQRLHTVSRDAAATMQLEEQKRLEAKAEFELEMAELKLEQFEATTALRKEQAEAKLQSAQANNKQMLAMIGLASAQAAVISADTQRQLSVIRAPRAGQVLRVICQEGEALAGQPVLQLGDTREMYVQAEVFETDVARISAGQQATVSSHALPEDLHGTVEQVLWTVASNELRSMNPAAPVDLRVVRVSIRLNPDDVAKHAELLGKLVQLEVDVRIHTAGRNAK